SRTSHSAARNPSTCGRLQVGSASAVSAQPTTCPLLLAPATKPCVPPCVGSAAILPSCHTKPRQTCPVAAGKKNEQLHNSPLGSFSAVSATPTTIPRLLFTGHSTALFGPPSVPRSVGLPSRHTVACMTSP